MKKEEKSVVLIDCGANIGASILYFREKLGKKLLKAYAFECDPINVKTLHTVFEDNEDVVIFNNGVWTENKKEKMYLERWADNDNKFAAHSASSLIPGKSNAANDGWFPNYQFEVSLIDLAEWIKKNLDNSTYNILKVDIEGAEYFLIPHLIRDPRVLELVDEWKIEITEPARFTNRFIKEEDRDNLVSTCERVLKNKFSNWTEDLKSFSDKIRNELMPQKTGFSYRDVCLSDESYKPTVDPVEIFNSVDVDRLVNNFHIKGVTKSQSEDSALLSFLRSLIRKLFYRYGERINFKSSEEMIGRLDFLIDSAQKLHPPGTVYQMWGNPLGKDEWRSEVLMCALDYLFKFDHDIFSEFYEKNKSSFINHSEEKMYTIGIIGNGFVGSAVAAGFGLHANIKIYDIDESKRTHDFDDVVNGSDFVFVGVPTPMTAVNGGEIDLSIMDNVFKRISSVSENNDTVFIVKSTVIPGTVERYVEKYKNLRIVFNPEFLTERAARLDFINASRVVIGGDRENVDKVESLYRERFPYVKIIKTDTVSAQFIKYMANCFFAVKVSFMNEMKQGCEALGGNWEDIMDGFVSDGRIGNSHLDVPGHDGNLGYGGKCFPKDINAFIGLFNDHDVDPALMKASWKKNLEVRREKDWSEIKGAVSE